MEEFSLSEHAITEERVDSDSMNGDQADLFMEKLEIERKR